MPHDASVRNHAAVPFILLVLLATGCGTPEKAGSPPPARSSADWFSEQAQATGLNFVHVNGMSGERFIAEIIGPGVALIDYDNDGDLDVYAVQGQPLRRSPEQRAESQDRLFRNDLDVQPDGSRSLRFTDVTAQAGVVPRSYGMGAAAGDINNDGGCGSLPALVEAWASTLPRLPWLLATPFHPDPHDPKSGPDVDPKAD